MNHLASCTKNLELYIKMMHFYWTILKKEVKTRLVFLVMVLYMHVQFSLVQSLSCLWLFATPWTTARQASLSITNSRGHPNPCPSSRWCHPTISSSIVPFSSCPQSFPTLGSFQMSQLFASGGMKKDKLCRKKLKSFKIS